MNDLPTGLARQLITATIGHAATLGIHVTAAVVDAGGHLIALERMDAAVLASLETAQVKARTSVLFGAPTKALPMAQPFTPALLGGVGYPLAFVPGGYPLRAQGRLIGGLAVGGGTSEQDETIVLAGLAVFDNAMQEKKG
jgi:uncharacterized protein GlcG (DUF336 family)